jgi:hypothetical protein
MLALWRSLCQAAGESDGLLLTQFREGYNFQSAVVTRGLTARQARAPVNYLNGMTSSAGQQDEIGRVSPLTSFQPMPTSTIVCSKPKSISFIHPDEKKRRARTRPDETQQRRPPRSAHFK